MPVLPNQEEHIAALTSIPIRRYFLRAVQYALPFWKLLITSGLLIVASSAFTLLAPWPLQFLIDNVLGHRPISPTVAFLLGPLPHSQYALVAIAALAGFFVTLMQHGFSVIDNYVNTKLEQNMILEFKSDIFRHAQQLSLSYHDGKRTGDFMARVNMGSNSIGFIPKVLPGVAQNIITLVGMFSITYLINAKLALVSMIVVPFLFFSTRIYSNRLIPQMLQVRQMEGESNAIVHESMAMIRVLIAFVRETHEFARFRSQAKSAINARIKLTVKQTLFSLGVDGITAAGSGLILALGAFDVINGSLTIGHLLVVLTYIQSMYAPLESISNTANGMQETFVLIHRCYQILDEVPEVVDTPDAVELTHVSGEVRYESVGFRYNNREQTLSDVSFEVPAGSVAAIVGPTGAGKTTLVSLLPRFYEAGEGRILLDGRDIRDIKVRSLREHISVVLQEPLLFSGTIADNIRYGRLDATMEEAVEAAKAANADDFVRGFPLGYETALGERGSKLSGGERQRISIARAFLKDAPILILDEPTSSIDSRTEAVILDALDRLMEGRTTFIIAHRLSTIRNADQVLVMNEGQLVERGTHESLLEANGLYRQLHDVQAAWMRERAEALLAGTSLVEDESA
jgi:ATP-binding cassette, subfamily B, bacterial